MNNLIGIVGDSGTGKSSAIRTLDPETTFIVNVTGKKIPVKGSSTKYNGNNQNVVNTDDYATILKCIQHVNNSPKFKTLILDDFGFVMASEYFKRANEPGFAKFADIGNHTQSILKALQSCREDLNVVVTWHPERILSDGSIVGQKIKTIGKLLEEKWQPEALFTILLYTDVKTNPKTKQAEYKFATRYMRNLPAKSPLGMFEEPLIDNDLKFVIDTATEYYK